MVQRKQKHRILSPTEVNRRLIYLRRAVQDLSNMESKGSVVDFEASKTTSGTSYIPSEIAGSVAKVRDFISSCYEPVRKKVKRK